MHGVYPALIVLFWMPGANDRVAILIEFHMKPDGVVGAAAEAVISCVVAPRIYYSLHHCFFVCLLFPTAKVQKVAESTK
jgi:hypothetical protein